MSTLLDQPATSTAGITMPPPVAAPTHAPSDREMTMMEHLQELRERLVRIVVSVVVGIAVSVIPIPGFDSLTHFAITQLADQAREAGVALQFIRPGEGFFTYLQVSLVIGLALSMPVLIWEILGFIAPALYTNEKRYMYIAVPGVTLSFVIGVLFCYKFMLPFAIQFLGGFGTDNFKAQWTAENYFDFVSSFLFWVGVTFELPIIMYFLSKLGIVSPAKMAKFRRPALVLAFVIGAIITPTPDPVNQTIVSLPIYLLFELGIILARFA